MKQYSFWLVLLCGVGVLMHMCPEFAMAQFSSGLERKVDGVTNGLINFLLPAASILGLVYSAILAATGDESAKSRMVLIGICSVIGMLAPLIIRWLQGLAG